ncbi:MAG TPA: glycosyltransferase family 4 protein [Agitococcus sp.]|nr:glycosyltransferase family 4 protein [Agitococcus sp.]
MRILFIHQNFPAQFKHLAPALAADKNNQVLAMHMRSDMPKNWQGVQMLSYAAKRGSTPKIHPWITDIETKVIRGEAAFYAAMQLKKAGFTPDVIIAHCGWGESLFVKDVWPTAKLAIYSEFYYHAQGADVGFDPEFPSSLTDQCRIRVKNTNNLLHFEVADAGISPTYWQASTFPQPFRDKITVVHDGIDTQAIKPNPTIQMNFKNAQGEITLSRNDEVITFVARNLEPYRGYHIFMRALPDILRQRPTAKVLIIGADGVSYGKEAPQGQTWKNIFINEVKEQVDWSRVFFLGQVPYPQFISLLQLSRVHIYLTYPYVLSWSLLEAMSAGCTIVASDTPPLKEAIIEGKTGRLVNFFDKQALANTVSELLADKAQSDILSQNARQFAVENYDLKSICLPKQLQWVQSLVN